MNNRYQLFNFRQYIAVISSAVILCFWAVWNSYPFVFSGDTATYIENAFSEEKSHIRSILYSVLIYYCSFRSSLWPVVFFQSLTVALIIFYFFKYFAKRYDYLRYYLGYVILITFFSACSFHVSRLMPDIFTAICILCICLLLLVKEMKKSDKLVISILLILSIGMHNLNFYVCIGVLFIIILSFIFRKFRIIYSKTGINIRQILFIMILTVSGKLLLTSVNYIYGGEFNSSRGTSIFMMGNLVKMGIIDIYLDEYCDTHDYRLCKFKDSLPNNLIWDENSPINRIGGWDASEKEFTLMINDLLSKPKYALKIIFKSVFFSFQQFFSIDIDDAHVPAGIVDNAIKNFYPRDYDNFKSAKQSRKDLNFNVLNFFQLQVVGFCLLFSLIVFLQKKSDFRFRFLILLLLLALVVNACFSGTLSGPFARYQSRLIWIISLPVFLYYMNLFMEKRHLKI